MSIKLFFHSFLCLTLFGLAGCSADMVEADNPSGHVHAENGVANSSGGNSNSEEVPQEPVLSPLPLPSLTPVPPSPVVSPTPPPAGGPKTVTFKIAKGTGSSSWNSVATAVQVVVGDTLIVKNEDTVAHQLHTNGVPCAHETLPMQPGRSYTCKISREFDGTGFNALHDHLYGNGAKFYLKAVK